MEERREKKKPAKPDFSWITKEEIKAKSGSVVLVVGAFIAFWGAPFIISKVASIIRSLKDLRKACKN